MAGFRTSHLAPLAALALAASLPAAGAVPAAAATTTYTITGLGSLGAGGTNGSAVNATGQVTGYSSLSALVQDPAGCPPNYPNPKKCVEHPWHAFLYGNGQMTDLGTLGPPGTWSFTQAVAINNNGQIAGTVFSGGTTEGFLYNNGTITNLGSFLAAAINDNGVMVGGDQIDTGGTLQNLNTLLPAGSPTIQDATAINNNGQIVASPAVLLNPS